MKTYISKLLSKPIRVIVFESFLCLLICAPSAFAQTPISCGQLTSGSITTAGQEVRYTFNATAGDAVLLRVVTTTNNFTPQLQVLFGTQVLGTTTGTISGPITQTGTYTIAVRYNSGSSQTGAYSLIWQSTKNPCGAIQISSCQTIKGNLSGPADIDAYRFNGTTGQAIKLQLLPLTTNLNLSSDIDLYDPDGLFVTSSSGLISVTLTKTGVYTVLVGTNLFNGMAGNYTLTLGNITLSLDTPNGGEIFLAGTAVPIKWRSLSGSVIPTSHDLLLSTDGGASFPIRIASGLSSVTQFFDWHISPLLAANNARIRVVAKAFDGSSCQDDSDTSFRVVGTSSMTPVAYKYDELSRLTQAVYDDGTGITYTYDAAGNRLSEVVGPVPFFKVTCNPATVNASAGTQGTTLCTVTSLNGFNSPVTVGCADAPAGLSCSPSPVTVTPPANGTINSTLNMAVGSTVPGGTYALRATGTGGGFTRSFNLNVAATDFSINCNPSTLNPSAGGSATSTCTVTSIDGFNNAVNLTCPGAPPGVTCSFSPATVTPPASGTINSTLTVSAATSAALGAANLQVTATSGSTVRTANLSLTVQPVLGETNLLNETFASGIPATWSVVDGSTGGGPAATWTTANPGNRSIGTPFATPFAIVDSDAAGSGVTQDEQLITPTINATGCNRVVLQFSNQFRRFSTEVADVDVSTNGGASWTNVLRITNGDDGYPTPNTKLIDITSAIAPNPSSFRVRFRYYNADYEWWWAIDNVRIRCFPASGTLQFSAPNYSVSESAGFRAITVGRTGDTSQPATVDYASSDHSNPADFISCTSPGPGLASSRCDFTTATGTLRFAAGETSKTFNVLINQDNYVEGTETLNLMLSNATGGAGLGTPSTAILSIMDDATEPATNPINNASDFVRSQYHDFLQREADGPGLAFWTDNIEKCNDPARRPAGQTAAQCIDKQRESTAIAFFMSPEFQITGGFVYHLYKGSLTGPPNYDGGSTGRFPTALEFLCDVSQVSEGIVVNNQISGAVVEANRNRLAAEFILRPEFVTKYGGLNNTLYVQELFNTTGIAATAAQKQALVDGLTSGTESRASVLRKVVDGTVVISEGNVQFTTPYGQSFVDQENRRLSVFMEYVGYLRRNPDAAGFIFWLGKLNQYNGDPFQAEMVRSFILAPEYRSRFGQP